MSEAIPSNVFWNRSDGEDDPFIKGNAIVEQERLRSVQQTEENLAHGREVRSALQGPTGNRVPAACKTPERCPLNDTIICGALPAACFWSCGVTNENRNA